MHRIRESYYASRTFFIGLGAHGIIRLFDQTGVKMEFDFNWYSTPLLFGFVQGCLYACLFWMRGWRQGRRSDVLFGCLLVAFSFEIWEYMLGFGGIEILWKELDFFPRTFGLLLPPLTYFYLKSQFNASFRFVQRDFKHTIPFLTFALYHIVVFSMGPTFVSDWKEKVHGPLGLEFLEIGAGFVSQVVYFYWAYQLYREYQRWAPSQFSDVEAVSFVWFRNFLIAFFVSNLLGWSVTLIDLWLDLDFWHDWWDELFNAALIYYLAITGYAQIQPRKLQFSSVREIEAATVSKSEKLPEAEQLRLRTRLEALMETEKSYLEPELALSDLAQRLGTNVSVLSAVVNGSFGKNFNDYVNEYRVEAVKKMLKDPEASHYSLLGIGLECGFNSKSTFNRAFKKITGVAPGDFARE